MDKTMNPIRPILIFLFLALLSLNCTNELYTTNDGCGGYQMEPELVGTWISPGSPSVTIDHVSFQYSDRPEAYAWAVCLFDNEQYLSVNDQIIPYAITPWGLSLGGIVYRKDQP